MHCFNFHLISKPSLVSATTHQKYYWIRYTVSRGGYLQHEKHFPLKLNLPRTALESKSGHIQRKTHDVFLCPLLAVGSAGLATVPMNYVLQCLPTFTLQGLDGYSKHAWGNIISCPSKTSKGYSKILGAQRAPWSTCEHNDNSCALPGSVSFHSKNDFMWEWNFSWTVVQSFLRVTERFYKCLQLGHVAKRNGR